MVRFTRFDDAVAVTALWLAASLCFYCGLRLLS